MGIGAIKDLCHKLKLMDLRVLRVQVLFIITEKARTKREDAVCLFSAEEKKARAKGRKVSR